MDRRIAAVDGRRYELLRVGLADGSETTVYVVVHPRHATRLRVACLEEARRLDHWCAANGRPEAIVAGFFVRDPWRPLGEVRIDGQLLAHEPVAAPFGPARSCVYVDPDGDVTLAPRREIAADPAGDLVQAGPRLVAGGRVVVDDEDREGFSAGAGQFDSDITAERHPRCALGINEEELFAVCCDGRRTASTPDSTSSSSPACWSRSARRTP
ncbi:MAG TPA: phosphodiester glycosidase family protein [Solirubrobacterales bacterium]|nr:phosphodiester glycosidase family protein [Solirubrobacterales bacterium]